MNFLLISKELINIENLNIKISENFDYNYIYNFDLIFIFEDNNELIINNDKIIKISRDNYKNEIINHINNFKYSGLKLNKDNTFVISLKKREDRRKLINEELSKNNIDYTFFNAIERDNGTLGCFLSHLEIIKKAKLNNLPYVFIFEDDCTINKDFLIPELPENWDMIFFGGAVNKIYDEYYFNWKKVSNWYAHCYIIRNTIYDKILNLANKYINIKAIDEIYCEDLHPIINSYIIYPTLASQREIYSDIEKCNLNRDIKIKNFDKLINMKNPNPKWIGDIYCINLLERNDKYDYVNNLFIENNLKVNIIRVEKHSNPSRGCLESHLKIIKEAKKRNLPNVLIFEDDIKILKNLNEINFDNIPKKWDMLYLGGNHINVNDKVNNDWFKIESWSTYGYLINNTLYDKFINELESTSKEIDRYFVENIHKNFNIFMINPKIIIPNIDFNYSDIEGKIVDYKFLESNLYLDSESKLDFLNENKINNKKEINKDSINKLPKISIITPTYNRTNMFKLAVHNYINTTYPKDKIEWIIIDEEDSNIKQLLPNDKNIKYYNISENDRKYIFKSFVNNYKKDFIGITKNKKKIEERTKKALKSLLPHKETNNDFYKNKLPIGLKRNIGVKYASHNIIVHMDDDDYYPPDSIMNRVLKLINSENINCVTCSAIASFNIVRMISMINVPPYDDPYEKRVSEATMCYYKKFWENNKFNNTVICSEGELFIKNRVKEVLDLDWKDIIISLRHSSNFTSRNELTEEPNGWHFGKIEDELFLFLTSLDNNSKTNNNQINL